MVSSSKKDTQRARVYRSDSALSPFAKGRALATTTDIEQWVRRIINKDYFRRNFPGIEHSQILIKNGGGTTHARGGWSIGRVFINAPLWSRVEHVMIHELAHVLTMYTRRHRHTCLKGKWAEYSGPWQAHGWQFAHIYLLIARNELGKEAHAALRSAFKTNKVRYNQPRQGRKLEGAEREAALARLASNRQKQAGTNAAKRSTGVTQSHELARLVDVFNQRDSDLIDMRVSLDPEDRMADTAYLIAREEFNTVRAKIRTLLRDAPTRQAYIDHHHDQGDVKRRRNQWVILTNWNETY